MIAEYCWHLSNGKSLFGGVIQDSLVKGIGIFRVDVDPDADRGVGEVVFRSIDPYDVYVDPMSRDFLFRDANYIIVQKNLSKSSLISMMPAMKRKIVRATGSTESKQYSMRDVHDSETIQPGDVENEAYTLEGEQDEILDYYEVYTKERVPYINAWIRQPPSAQELQIIRDEARQEAELIAKDIEVSLKEREVEFSQLVQEGEMLPERMEVEMQKAEILLLT
jgi:hypothetical protein